jgi:hypothetical protein
VRRPLYITLSRCFFEQLIKNDFFRTRVLFKYKILLPIHNKCWGFSSNVTLIMDQRGY